MSEASEQSGNEYWSGGGGWRAHRLLGSAGTVGVFSALYSSAPQVGTTIHSAGLPESWLQIN